MDLKPGFKWTDKVRVIQAEPYREDDMTFDQLRTRLFGDPLGIQEQRFNFQVNLQSMNALYMNTYTIPAGWKLKHCGILVLSPIITGGTTAALGLGLHSATPVSTYGFTSSLLINGVTSKLIDTIFSSDTALELCAVTSDGSAMGDTAITGGTILLSLTFDSPAKLTP